MIPPGPNVLFMVACDLCGLTPPVLHAEHTVTGCELWRCLSVCRELQRQGYGARAGFRQTGAEWIFKDDGVIEQQADTLAAWYDAVILPRLSWRDHAAGAKFINALHRAGKAVILEMDDDLLSESVNARIRATTQPGMQPADLEQRRLDRLQALRLVDGVTVSTRRLATVVRSLYDGPVQVCENAIDLPWFRGMVKQATRRTPGLTVGWAGGIRPDDDLEPVFWAWGQLAVRYPALTFVVAGHQPPALGRYVPEARVRRLPWLPIDQYPKLLREIDIACVAVADQAFNRSKSVIKVWESTLGGAVVCATPTLYGQAISDGVDGLLAETPAEWLAQLSRLVDSKPLRRALRRAQRERIGRDHTLAANAWRWPAAWTAIVNDFRAKRAAPRLVLAR